MGCLEHEIYSQIDILLNKDLELLAPEERTVKRWLELLGEDEEFNDAKIILLQLQDSLEELEKARE